MHQLFQKSARTSAIIFSCVVFSPLLATADNSVPSSSWHIGPTGYGPVRIGMTFKEVSRALGKRLTREPSHSVDCFSIPVQTERGHIGLLFQKQRLTSLEISLSMEDNGDPRHLMITTAEGIKIGDGIGQVDAAYRGQAGLKREEFRDEVGERSVIYWNRKDKRGIRFLVDPSGHVYGIDVGTKSIMDYESCD